MNQSQPMQDKDWMNAILTYEKHISSEYATAVTESNCSVVRQMFSSLLNDSLSTQEEVFRLMSQQGWYANPAKAVRQDVDKQFQTYQQTQQQIDSLFHQHHTNAAQRGNYIQSQYNMPMQPGIAQHQAQDMYPRGH